MVDLIKSVLNGREWQTAAASASVVSFESKVLDMCKLNYCGQYGTRWTCPPGTGSLEKIVEELSRYKNIFVFTTKHSIEDSFDIEGMMEARKLHDEIQSDVKKALAGKDVKILGVGGCSLCEKCTYPSSPCRFPDRVTPAMEACGINVVTLSATLGINYINGANTVTYFSAIFY